MQVSKYKFLNLHTFLHLHLLILSFPFYFFTDSTLHFHFISTGFWTLGLSMGIPPKTQRPKTPKPQLMKWKWRVWRMEKKFNCKLVNLKEINVFSTLI